MAAKWSEICAPASRILNNHPLIGEWKAAIGHVVVAFGAVERLMLAWAIALTDDEDLLRRHHKNDMKKIAPAVRRIVTAKRGVLPDRPFKAAMDFIDRAESLIPHRNDVAHGWIVSGPSGGFALLVAKKDQRPKLVFGVRDLGWVVDCGRKMDDAIIRCREIAIGTCAYVGGAIERLKRANILD